MQNVEVIEKSVKLIKEMLTINKKLRVNVLETNYLNETRIFIIVGFNLIGKALFMDNEGINKVIELLEGVEYQDPDYSVAEMCSEADESMGVDNWCFELEDKNLFKMMKVAKPNRVQYEEYKKSLSSETVGMVGLHCNYNEVPQTPITKVDLEEQRVIIYESKPVTNTLCLAKDFNVTGYNMIVLINEIVSLYPYMLNDLSVGFYENENNIGKHYIIQEPVYVKFLEMLPKDRSENPYKRIKLREEYYTAFSKMREWFYSQNFKTEEVERIMKYGKETTSLLITRLEIRFNEGRIDKSTQDMLMQSLFNHVNVQIGIDSMSYIYSNNNRENLSEQNAKELEWMENVIIEILVANNWTKYLMGQLNMYISKLKPFTEYEDFNYWIMSNQINPNNFKEWTFRNPYKVNKPHAIRLHEELMNF